ncbi:MAG: glycosyltransferase family 9 protein [Chthoniobacter sp.]|nr:glycosyltransferase family 9 protein [Chthoniobacter sp.]
MRILALQLKRIGDLVLTAAALRALREAWPEAHLALAVAPGCAALLGAFPSINTGVVLGRGRGFRPWQQVLTGPWDLCLDFTGTDRSALAVALSRARKRATFAWVQKRKLRAVAFNCFVDSAVRERHTVDHYLDLAEGVIADGAHLLSTRTPDLALPEASRAEAARMVGDEKYAVIHPGTARAEKFWLPERWAEVIAHLRERHGLACVLTGGTDDFERAHLGQIQAALARPALDLAGKMDLLTFAAVLAQARLCVSADTGAVHLAAAFRTPQVALYGPTNPFHWRPRHERALVLSATQPDAPLTTFTPRMKGAPMERISTSAVIRATDALLS